MQLKKPVSIRGALTTITAALVGATGVAHGQSSRVESSLLLYSERHRVTAGEGVVGIQKLFKNDLRLSLKLTLDGLTGPTPNGALPSARPQTFTSPSRRGEYVVPAGELPLNGVFRDSRVEGDASLTLPLDRVTSFSLGGHGSGEHDYSSFGFNGGITRDLFRHNTTIGLSVAYSHDLVSPEGGAPIPLAEMPVAVDDQEGSNDDEDEGGTGPGKGKNVFDFVGGVTQVINRQTLFRLNYSLSRLSGYLNDPYKIISVINGENSADPGAPVGYLFESRPEHRTGHALFAELRRHLGGDVVDVSYRRFWDNWGIRSNTIELSYLKLLANRRSLRPHVRYYRQSQADFFRYFVVAGEALPLHASADSRLGTFTALTTGLDLGIPIGEKLQVRFSAEYYRQFGDRSPPELPASLRGLEVFPGLDALMLRVGFTRDF